MLTRTRWLFRYPNTKDGPLARGYLKEYVRENLSNYAEGMSKAMKRRFNFVNIAHGTMRDVTATALATVPTVATEPTLVDEV